jgi:NAD(P)-dependent dehydrogenase (short-subunit alcohol dehydrogenase family)
MFFRRVGDVIMSWVVITGGALGLGADLCTKLAKSGYSIIIHYNTSLEEAERVKELCMKEGVNVKLAQADFTCRASVEKFTEQLLELNVPIKYLINNVGNYLIDSLLKTSENHWYELFQVNVHAPFLLTKKLSDSIRQQKGSILNIGVAGLESGKADTYSAAYSLTKQVLLGMTKSLAKELAPYEVTVNMISPGYMTNSVDLPTDLSHLPMKRAVELSEITDLVQFLFSESGKSITGQNIEIAGGVRI